MNKKCFLCHKSIRGEHPMLKIEVDGLFLKVFICNSCGHYKEAVDAIFEFSRFMKVASLRDIISILQNVLKLLEKQELA